MLLSVLVVALTYISSSEATANCVRNADLTTHKEMREKFGIPYEATVVNKSVPAAVIYSVRSGNLEVKSISWQHDNKDYPVNDNSRREIYYAKEVEGQSLRITLHIAEPNARRAGNWTLDLITEDGLQHKAVCFVETAPIIRPRFGAVRGKEGNSLSMQCDIDSYPPPSSITWFHVIESETETKSFDMVPIKGATFETVDGVKNAMVKWKDATNHSGHYLCKAVSSRGVAQDILEVRVKSVLAPLWPFIGILVELVVLGITIAVFEVLRARSRKANLAAGDEAPLLKSSTHTPNAELATSIANPHLQP